MSHQGNDRNLVINAMKKINDKEESASESTNDCEQNVTNLVKMVTMMIDLQIVF